MARLTFFLLFMIKKTQKDLQITKNVVPLHPKTRTMRFSIQKLGYGVMVTLQILVLPFLVRVRVAQQKLSSARLRVFLYP